MEAQVKYKVKDWEDLKISDAIELTNLKIPNKLKELYSFKTLESYDKFYKEFTEKDFIYFARYYGKILKIMTDIPHEDIELLQWYDRISIYETYCQNMIVSLYSANPVYKAKNIKYFEFEGIKYYLPETLKLLDNEIPMAKETALSFTEGASLYSAIVDMKEEGINQLPYFIAVYCRPKDEPYNEDKSIQRAEKFKNLTMDIAWEVFFCIMRLLTISAKNMTTYLEKVRNTNLNTAKAG
jgi:hypothetical protein